MAIGEHRRERYTPSKTTTGKARTIVWGAVIAGVILAIAVQLMLGLLGLGVGLGSLPGSGGSATALTSVAGIYALIAALVGLFVGGYATARFALLSDKIDALLHGLVTWAVATLLVVVVLGGTASSVLGGAFGAVGASVESLSRAAGTIASSNGSDGALPDSVTADLRALLSSRSNPAPASAENTTEDQAENGANGVAEPSAPVATAENFAAIAAGLSERAGEGERQAAVDAIMQIGDLSRTAAEQRLASYQQSFDEMVRQVRQTADTAARSVATAAFSAFVALLLGALASAGGGYLGRPRSAV